MNKRLAIASAVGLLTGGVLLGLGLTNRAGSVLPIANLGASGNQTLIGQAGMMMMGNPDQWFITEMIPHHQDAVDMAELALSRAQHSELKQLAAAIKRDQTREIKEMQTWYRDWYGQDVPPGTMQEMMQGGMMQVDLQALKTARDFDREFIRQMIPHHQMAVHMAQMVLNRSTRPQIRTLAGAIIKTQTAEIQQMQQWLQAWSK